MLKIGLTGHIASGKTLAATHLKTMGAAVIDADTVAREIVAPGTPALSAIEHTFGEQYLFPDGALNRRLLGELVFSDPAELKKLEVITHPAIFAEIDRQIAAYAQTAGYPAVVVEASLLLEGKGEHGFDEVWLVVGKKEDCLQRLMERDSLSIKTAADRFAAQVPVAQKIKEADCILENYGSREAFLALVEKNWQRILAKEKKQSCLE